MAGQGAAPATGEQAHVVFQLHQQPCQAEAFNLRGHQFDCQGNTVQALADINRQGQLGFAEFKTVLMGHGAFDQQLQGRVTQGLGPIAAGGRAGQRFEALHGFALGPQRFAAGGEDVQVRRVAQQGFADQCDVVQQVFAIVDDQQQLTRLQVAGERQQRLMFGRREVEQGGEVGQDHRRRAERRQVQQANAVAIMSNQQLRHAQRHGRLADATRAGQGDKALLGQLLHQCIDECLAADHPRAAQRQVMALAMGNAVCRNRHRFDAQWRHKTVAALGHRDDITLPGLAIAQCLAQRRHMHPQVGVFHHSFRPDPGDQLLLAHHVAGVFQQDQQNLHRAPPQTQRPTGFEHQPLVRVDAVGAEMHGLVAEVIHGGRSSGIGSGQHIPGVCRPLGRNHLRLVTQLVISPGHRVDPFTAREHVAEVRLVAKPALQADLRQAQGGMGDQFLGAFDALLANPLLR